MDMVLPTPGKYVVAVSGGVDSVSLLHALVRQMNGGIVGSLDGDIASEQQAIPPPHHPTIKLLVAHFDHGIREDSTDDRLFVQELARQYEVPFVYDQAELGPGASEAAARTARYRFLRAAMKASGARAIITAHHQDDLLETAILNLLRGTGRKGLTSLSDHHDLKRPLLHIPKNVVKAYARDQGLRWREDSTNQDQRYLRNYVRHRILPRFDKAARAQLWEVITKLQTTNHQLDSLLISQLHFQSKAGKLDRQWFNHLPHSVARETMAAWLRSQGLRSFDSRTLERLVVAAKVGQAGSQFDVLQGVKLILDDDHLALTRLER